MIRAIRLQIRRMAMGITRIHIELLFNTCMKGLMELILLHQIHYKKIMKILIALAFLEGLINKNL